MADENKQNSMSDRLKAHGGELKKSFVKQVSVLMTTAFGLIAALAWNTAIQSAVSEFISTGSQLVAALTYAIIVTLLAVVATFYISRVSAKLGN
jgi:uncharacterized membrane protein YgdD (TMEM256/DUF423 family)